MASISEPATDKVGRTAMGVVFAGKLCFSERAGHDLHQVCLVQ
jgi:hypothetical protein